MTRLSTFDTLLFGFSTTTQHGVSGESTSVGQAWESAYHHYIAPISRAPLAVRFADLAETWKEERGASSSLTEIVLQPAYQRIIGLGPTVVPSILAELAATPDHWFWALTAITGTNPIPDEAAGDLSAMTQAWLDWGEREGIAI
jgi:hypothetical protein